MASITLRKGDPFEAILIEMVEILAEVFGPQWRGVVEVVRRSATLTDDEVKQLALAWNTADPARDAARDAARIAARAAARDAAWNAARDAARDAARIAAWDIARAVVIWDLATTDGPYTFTHRDLLMAPWIEVCGLPAGLLDTLDAQEA